MAKLYVPDGAWLVCSNGMKKQQIKVTSQSKVTIAGGYLKATVDDRPGGNFMCGKMIVAGAIIGAVAGIALVAGSIVSGGALAVAAIAAAGAAAGAGISLIPSICGMLLHDWTPFDTNVLTVGKHPLLENSQIPCRLGGNVMILFSEKAADEFTDITIGRTAINTVGVIALSYLLYPALAAIGTSGSTAIGTFAKFGWKAGLNYVGGAVLATGTAYAVGWGIDQAKGGIYSVVPTGDGNTVKTYVDGFETDPDKIVGNYRIANAAGDKALYEHTNDVGGALGVGKDAVGNRTSTYYEQTTTQSVRLDDIEERGATQTSSVNRIDGAIAGRNSQVGPTYRVVTGSDYGGRYQIIEENQFTQNSQYVKNNLSLKGSAALAGTAGIGALKDNFGRPGFDPSKGGAKGGVQGGGFYMGLLQDAYKGITNFLLKGQADDLIEALQNEEAAARAKTTVLAGKD
ncbi:PAAR-like protein [uncultured Chryseobacterium sp.]|uniref:PAAR-like protein n=1 Tax=uncultured Chryseobacterium sp. TaxID=259322 RepID=UPI0025D17462|nr:PAAR-like protein [uncultured Chryseobacterium sp.]